MPRHLACLVQQTVRAGDLASAEVAVVGHPSWQQQPSWQSGRLQARGARSRGTRPPRRGAAKALAVIQFSERLDGVVLVREGVDVGEGLDFVDEPAVGLLVAEVVLVQAAAHVDPQ